MPWTCGKNTCPSRYTFFGKGCKRILFRGLERATWTGYSNSKNRPLTLFEKEYYDPPPAYRRRPEITRMEAQTASARGYLKLPGRHPFPAAGGQRKGTSLRMSLSFGTPEGIRTSDLPLRSMVYRFVRCPSHNCPCYLVLNDVAWLLVNLHKNPCNAAS